MDLDKIALTSMLQTKMKYDAARQDAISQNIANVDTPGYNRKEVTKPDFKNMVKTHMLGLETTNPQHISGTNSSSSSYAPYSTDDKVEIDMEAIEMMKNNADFSKTSTTYRKILSLIKEAIGNK